MIIDTSWLFASITVVVVGLFTFDKESERAAVMGTGGIVGTAGVVMDLFFYFVLGIPVGWKS